MNINDFFSNYLKASDFSESKLLTITTVRVETLGQGEEATSKPVVYFKDTDKGIVLGPTTGRQISEMLGTDDTDQWGGKSVIAFNDLSVTFRGNTGGIRFRKPSPSQGSVSF